MKHFKQHFLPHLFNANSFFVAGSVIISVFLFFFSFDAFKRIYVHHVQIERLDDRGITQMVKKCGNTAGWRNCYGDLFGNLTKTHSLQFALNTLQMVETKDAKTQDCHIMAHRIVTEEIAKEPKKWKDVLLQINQNACNYGYIHGIVEGLSRFDPNFVFNEKTIPGFCEIVIKTKPTEGIDQTCAHVMGHVLLVDQDGNIPNAVHICGKLPQNFQYQCNSGVFMESYTRDNLVVHGLASYRVWDDAFIGEQENLCHQYSGLASRGCWLEIAFMYTNRFPNDQKKLWEYCNHAIDTRSIYECYDHGLVALIEKQNPSDEYLQSLCSPFLTNQREFGICLGYIVHSLINSSILTTPTAIHYCDVVKNEHGAACFSMIGRFLATRSSASQQKAFCAKAPNEYRVLCEKRSTT